MGRILILIILFNFQFSIFNFPRAHADSGTVLLGKAIEYYQGRKYHESILTFEKLRRKYQLNPRFTAYLGFSYYKENMYEEAVECLEESIPQLTAYSPLEQAVYLYACAESHFNLAQYQQALPYYKQALPLTTGLDAADINYHMAFCYYLDETLRYETEQNSYKTIRYETQSEIATKVDTLTTDSLTIDTLTADSLTTDSLVTDTIPVNVTVEFFLEANRLYKEAAAVSPLSPLHTARLAQTTKMLRAFMREEE